MPDFKSSSAPDSSCDTPSLSCSPSSRVQSSSHLIGGSGELISSLCCYIIQELSSSFLKAFSLLLVPKVHLLSGSFGRKYQDGGNCGERARSKASLVGRLRPGPTPALLLLHWVLQAELPPSLGICFLFHQWKSRSRMAFPKVCSLGHLSLMILLRKNNLWPPLISGPACGGCDNRLPSFK